MSETAKAISIITPVWNGLPFLQECVESVQKQSFQNWEMLIGDNGSTDGTHEYLKAIRDPRIRVFYHKENLGIFGNLNFLFEQASAPISQILCADDYLFDDGLQTIVSSWEEVSSDVGAIRFNMSDMKNQSTDVMRLALKVVPKEIRPDQSDLLFFTFGNLPGNLSNMSVRTRLVPQVGGFDQRYPYAGDFEFWQRLARTCAIAMLGTDVIYVRRHPGVASNYLNTKGELCKQLGAIAEELYSRLSSKVPKKLLRLHATVTYDTLNRHVGFKKWLKTGDTSFLRTLDESSNSNDVFFGYWMRWLLYFMSGGGHWGRGWIARRLLGQSK